MSLYRPKRRDRSVSPWWHYDFSLDGVRFRGCTRCRVKREAARIEERERKRALHGEAERPVIMLSQAFARYTNDHARYLPSAKDVVRAMDRLLARLGDVPLHHLTDNDVATLVARRRGDRARHRPGLVSNATVNRDTELLRRVVRTADDKWGCAVPKKLRWGKHLLPERQERAREASAKEESDLLANLRPDLVPLVRFCGITGTRLGSAIRLTWAAVDYDAGQVVLHDKGNARTQGDRTRVIPITGALRALLANEKGKHPIYVFTYLCRRSLRHRRRGAYYPFSRNGWRRDWAKALEAAGIADFRFHDLRHTAGSRVTRERGIRVTQKLLGHTSIVTTQRYAHVELEDLREAMEAVSRHADANPDQAAATKAKK